MLSWVPMAFPRAVFIAIVLSALLGAAPGPARAASSPLPDLPIADCGMETADAASWHANRRLDEAARRWALGADLSEAVARSGYTAAGVSGLRFYGLDAPDRPRLNAASCRILRDRTLTDLGAFRRDDELWVVFAAPEPLPKSMDAG